MNNEISKILQERGARYGEFKDHARISQMFKAVARTPLRKRGVRLSDAHNEALDMICHKLARIVNGDPNHKDSWADIAGYATLVVNEIGRLEQDAKEDAQTAQTRVESVFQEAGEGFPVEDEEECCGGCNGCVTLPVKRWSKEKQQWEDAQ